MENFINQIKDKIPPELLHQVQKAAHTFRENVWPQVEEILAKVRQSRRKDGTPDATPLAASFRHILVVGLNRSELNPQGETTPIFNDNWQDLLSEHMRRHLAMVFFAPRGLDGDPVNPYLFLTGALSDSMDSMAVQNTSVEMAEQALNGVGLLDFCRVSPAMPNTLNIILAADVLFHWDVKDSYVLPTSPTTWVRDLEQVMRTYPRTTRAHIYTSWDTEILPPSERVKVHPLRDLPLDDQAWLNQPTFQEKYGSHMMFAAITLAVLTFGGLYMKQRAINDLNEQLRMIEQQIPGEGRLSELERGITEQERMQKMREVFFLTVKDSARAISRAGMKTSSFEVRNPDPATPPKQLLVTFEAEKDAYSGWLEEEPIARGVLVNSALLTAVRKLPGTGYKLEGLVNLEPALRDYRKAMPQGGGLTAGQVAGTSPTTVMQQEEGEE